MSKKKAIRSPKFRRICDVVVIDCDGKSVVFDFADFFPPDKQGYVHVYFKKSLNTAGVFYMPRAVVKFDRAPGDPLYSSVWSMCERKE